MSYFDDIQRKRSEIRNNILKGFGVSMSEEDIEKAHKDGDLHPNGKWVWVSSAAGGKGDWRTLNGRTHKKHTAANAGSAGSSATAGNSGIGTAVGKVGSKKSGTVKPTATGNSDVVGALSSINTTYGKVDVSHKGEWIRVGKRYVGIYLKDDNLIELKQRSFTNPNRRIERDIIQQIASSLAKIGFSKKISYEANERHGDSKAYMEIVLKPTKISKTSKKHSSTITTEGNVSSIIQPFKNIFSISNSEFTDLKKMSVGKMSQGYWVLYYDGKRVSMIAPLTDADKKELESAGVTFDYTFKSKTKTM